MLLFNEITPEIAALADHAFQTRAKHPILTARPSAYTTKQRETAALVTEWIVLEDQVKLAALSSEFGPMVYTVLVLTCGCLWGIEKIEGLVGIPARSGKLVVQIGLDEIKRKGIA